MTKKVSALPIEDVIKLRHIFPGKPLSIIPLRLETKLPAVKWKDVIEGKPFTDEELRELWKRFRGKLNPGIACGRFSGDGLVVVDLDGTEAIEWAKQNLPPTDMIVVTRSGEHWYYRIDPKGDRIPNLADALGARAKFAWEAKELGLDITAHLSQDQSPEAFRAEQERAARAREEAEARLKKGPMIDVRGDGGQVVAPGAIHPTGFVYKMKLPWTPEMLERVPFYDPIWFEGKKWTRPGSGPRTIAQLAAKRVEREREAARQATTPEERIKRYRAWLREVDGAVSGQGGHNKTFYVACRGVVGFLVPPEEVFQILKEEYNPRCQPPWSDEELAHKVLDAEKQLGHNNGYMLVDRPEFKAKKKVRELKEYVPSAADFDAVAEEKEERTEIEGSGPSNLPPGPPPTGGSGAPPSSGDEPLSDDEREWAKRWYDPFGVDYVRHLRGTSVKWTRKQGHGGVWQIPPDPNNLIVVLRFSKYLGHTLRWNELKCWPEIDGKRLTDQDVLRLKSDLEHMWQRKIPKEDVRDAIDAAAASDAYEPVQEWLTSLTWDGIPRIDRVPHEILGTDDTPINSLMFRHTMTALVARIMEPGTKVDHITILVGPQGAKKSQFWRLLIDGHLKGGKWFTDQPFKLGEKDGQMLIGTNQIVEWSESEHAKSEIKIDRVKLFLSQQEDEFRPPYGRNIITRKRRCIFVGTSNDSELLHDVTGSRRFYIMKTSSNINTKKLLEWREQLFAEALTIYRRWCASTEGDPEYEATRWWLTEEEDAARRKAVKEFESRSAWHEDILAWVEDRMDKVASGKLKQPEFTIGDVIKHCLSLTVDKKTKRIDNEVRKTLISIGCRELGNVRRHGRKARWWAPPERREDEPSDDNLPF